MSTFVMESALMGLRRVMLVAGVMLALFSVSRARAGDVEAMSRAAATCQGPDDEIPLAAALVSPQLDRPARGEEGLVWDVRFILDVDASFDFQGGRIPFAAPLPPGEELRPSPGVTAIVRSERVVGICVSPEALRDRSISASFAQRAPGGDLEVGAPIATGSFVQIIAPTSAPDVRLELEAGALLERHVGFVAQRGVGHAAREEARRLVDLRVDPSANPVYLRGDDARAGGLRGRLVDARARSRQSAVAAFVVFGAVVAALVLVARRLRHRASVERADALLAAEIDQTGKRHS